MRLLIRILINAAALWVTAELINGISLDGDFGTILVVALIFGLVNAVVRPILKLFTFPAILLTLGLFLLIINALMLMLTASLTSALTVDGFGSALLGGIVISIVSWLLSVFLNEE